MIRTLFIAMWALLVLAPAHVMAEEIVINRILVKINDSIITQFDLDEEIKPVLNKIKGRTLSAVEQQKYQEFRRQKLEQMVNDLLLQQEIDKYKIKISDEVVDKEVKRMMEQNGLTKEEFVSRVQEDGLTMQEFRDNLKGMIEKQELLAYMVHEKVLVTDTEVAEFYESHIDDYKLDSMVELAIIICPSDVSVIEVRKRILDEEMTFAEAAKEYSVGPNPENGGLIGDVNWDDLEESWQNSLEGVEEGGVSTPVTARGNEALLSPVKIMSDRRIPLEDVHDKIFERLMQEKRETSFDEYFEKLKQSAVIEYMDKQ